MTRLTHCPLSSAVLLVAAATFACAVAVPEDGPSPTRDRLVEEGADLAVSHGSVAIQLQRGDTSVRVELEAEGWIEVAAAPGGDVAVEAVDLYLGSVEHAGGAYPDGVRLRDLTLRSERSHWCRSAVWSGDVCEAAVSADLFLEGQMWAGDDAWLDVTIPVYADLALLLYANGIETAAHVGGDAVSSLGETLPLSVSGIFFDLDLEEKSGRTVIF